MLDVETKMINIGALYFWKLGECKWSGTFWRADAMCLFAHRTLLFIAIIMETYWGHSTSNMLARYRLWNLFKINPILSVTIPPTSTKLKAGYTGITLSVCPSVRPSVCPSVDKIVSALYLQQYSLDPFHICTSYQATKEGVSRVMPVSKLKNLKFWRIFLIRNFDFVFFWLGIQYDSMVWVIIRRWGYPPNAGVLVVLVFIRYIKRCVFSLLNYPMIILRMCTLSYWNWYALYVLLCSWFVMIFIVRRSINSIQTVKLGKCCNISLRCQISQISVF